MAAQYGTTLPVVKPAIVTLLQARVNGPDTPFTVGYASPLTSVEVLAESGNGVAVWFGDETPCDHTIPAFKSGDKWFDESYTLTLVVQGLPLNTDDTQQVIDTRASQALGEVIGMLAEDPACGITDTSAYEIQDIVPAGWTYRSGALNSQRAGHFEVRLEVNARLKLT